MPKEPVHIKFQNSQNPNAAFDLIRLEDLFSKEFENHSPFKLHLVEFFIIILIEEGHGKHTIDFTEYAYKRGTIFTIRKDQIHKFNKNLKTKGTLLLFTDEFLVSYLEKLESLKSMQLFNEILAKPKLQLSKKGLVEISDLIARIENEYFRINDPNTMGIIRSELHILITKLFRLKSEENKIIPERKYLSEFINFQNLVEQHVIRLKKVKDYAKMIGLSTRTLNTISRTIVNKSAKEFVDDISAKQIKRLLINTDLSVKEIAHASGFEETTNFYKYFKRQTTLTPEQFRQSYE